MGKEIGCKVSDGRSTVGNGKVEKSNGEIRVGNTPRSKSSPIACVIATLMVLSTQGCNNTRRPLPLQMVEK
jgi:hypothetical protein